MCGARGLCMFFIVFVAGTTDSVTFQQISSLFANESGNITIHCSHDDSSLPVMLWYQQKRDSSAMALIGYTYGTNEPKYEDEFKKQFQLKRKTDKEGDLIISELLQSDSAVYYCAAKEHSDAYSYDCRTETSNTKHTGTTDSVTFQQISSLFTNESNSITIECSHDDSNLPVMLWYQQKRDSTAMALIGYTYGPSNPNNEDGFKKRFHLKRKTDQKGDLIISELLQSDSAVYYCAAKEHSAAYSFDCRTKTSNTKHTETVESIQFQQFPPVIINQIDTAKFRCSHDDGSLTQMLWFHQKTASTALTLIGYGFLTGAPTIETEFTDRFKMARDSTTSGELIISDVKPSDSAVCFCAASLHSAQLRVTCSLKT
ncbi:hypothetical protein MHYP_G00133300 [Metynnis hypsauchen]